MKSKKVFDRMECYMGLVVNRNGLVEREMS